MKAIMYHYIREYDAGFPYFKSLHVDDFKNQLDYFESNFGFVSQDDFVLALQAKKNTHGIVLTFDDGLKDHFDYVFPLLKERGLWGIFYIPTLMYERKQFLDVHKIHLLLGKFPAREVYESLLNCIEETYLTHQHIKEFRELTYADQVNDDYFLLVKRTLNYFIDTKWRTCVLDRLMDLFFHDERELFTSFYLAPRDIDEMHSGGMIIGSHTVTHPVMSKLSAREQKREIENSFFCLKNIVGEFKMKTFCYPYGGFHTFTKDTEQLLQQQGCAFSFNVETRDIELNDLMLRKQALPRYDCNYFPYGQCRPEKNKNLETIQQSA